MTTDWFVIFPTGAGTGAGLIIAIGAQNAFVLTQGIRKQYAGLVATCCAVIDIVLINAGIAGLGALIQARPALGFWAAVFGALFLFVYGAKALNRFLALNVWFLRKGQLVEMGRNFNCPCFIFAQPSCVFGHGCSSWQYSEPVWRSG